MRMNGFGCVSLDTGHRREPEPPQRMTGMSMVAFREWRMA